MFLCKGKLDFMNILFGLKPFLVFLIIGNELISLQRQDGREEEEKGEEGREGGRGG